MNSKTNNETSNETKVYFFKNHYCEILVTIIPKKNQSTLRIINRKMERPWRVDLDTTCMDKVAVEIVKALRARM